MKSRILIVALLAFFATTQAQVTFKPGIRGGVNFAHFTKGDNFGSYYYYDNNGNYVPGDKPEFKTKTDFYLGFYGALRLTKYYTLQPEVDYSRQGTVVEGTNGFGDADLEVSYLSVAIANKFTFNEKLNVHVGPTIDVVVDNNFDTESELDLAFFLGVGYNFTKNFGIEGRVKKGIIPVLDDYSDSYHTNVVFSLGATYTFDLK